MSPTMSIAESTSEHEAPRRHADGQIHRILSADSEVAKAYDRNETRRPYFVKAAQWLKRKGCSESEAIEAMRKLKYALTYEKVPIFVSYKAAQAGSVREIIAALESGSSKVEMRCADRIQAGARWSDYIDNETASANWLILLYMDPNMDWEWCLYECGMFVRAMRPGDRLVCLHPPAEEPPNQLSQFHAVPVEPASLDRFLNELFTKEGALPGLGALNSQANIAGIRDRIIKAFTEARRPGGPKRLYCDHFVEFSLEDPLMLVDPSRISEKDRKALSLANEDVRDPDQRRLIQAQNQETVQEHNLAILKDADIKDIDDPSLQLFDWAYKPSNFGELISHVVTKHVDKRWLYELCIAVKNVAVGRRVVEPIYATFQPPSGKVYRVILHAIDRFITDGIERYHIIFAEDVASPGRLAFTDKNLAALAELLRMTYRMRMEVLKPSVGEPNNEATIKSAIEALRRIEGEARSLGFVRPDLVLNILNEEDRATVDRMLKEWEKVRSHDPHQYPGDLDRAIDRDDYANAGQILAKFWPMNKEFLVLLSRSFAKKAQELEA